MTTIHRDLIGFSVGITMIAFGLNQLSRPYKWTHYIPAAIKQLMPLQDRSLMRLHGSGNVSIGLLLIAARRMRAPWIITTLWWSFVTPLCGRYDWRTGLRDLTITATLFSVAVSWNGK